MTCEYFHCVANGEVQDDFSLLDFSYGIDQIIELEN